MLARRWRNEKGIVGSISAVDPERVCVVGDSMSLSTVDRPCHFDLKEGCGGGASAGTFFGGRCSRLWDRAHQGSLMDRQTKKELWVLAISASAVPLVAGVAAFLIR